MNILWRRDFQGNYKGTSNEDGGIESSFFWLITETKTGWELCRRIGDIGCRFGSFPQLCDAQAIAADAGYAEAASDPGGPPIGAGSIRSRSIGADQEPESETPQLNGLNMIEIQINHKEIRELLGEFIRKIDDLHRKFAGADEGLPYTEQDFENNNEGCDLVLAGLIKACCGVRINDHQLQALCKQWNSDEPDEPVTFDFAG